MTNPLSPEELAACWTARQKYLESDYNESLAEYMFSAALDYLRAELAKAEPVGYFFVNSDGYYAQGHKDGLMNVPLYLRPSEPSKALTTN